MLRIIQLLSIFSVCMLGMSFMACKKGQASSEQKTEATIAEADTLAVEQVSRGLEGKKSSKVEWGNAPEVPPFPYRLTKESDKVKLPSKLEEVSAVSYLGNGLFALIQDEKGKIYIFDPKKEEVVEDYKFRRSGDFEGLVVLGDTAYALKSNGSIYEIPHYREDDIEPNKFDTFLSPSDDTEGLCYFAEKHWLLIGAKEPPVKNGKELTNQRAIYAFDLKTHELQKKPYIMVDMQELKEFLVAHAKTDKAKERAEKFDPNDKDDFKPSDLNIHPITRDIYIIASAGRMMVVLNKDYKIIYAKDLDRDVLKQPEGITFTPDGDMFITNEGRGGKGNLLRFAYKP